ncbi:MAG: 50S ribosomal protein L10 [Elusimicrobia bacterium RIFCSPLOWO2_12_FULL_59_9]|nr:MAG: 50S ribosomal protein L10 [Elusimicrobia bacterium RIFCSPLOWO2_12_FULL_59_9]
MKLTRAAKKQKSSGLAETFKDSSHVYFTGFQGLKFQHLQDLRLKLKPFSSRYQVVKNSIAHHALKEAGMENAKVNLFEGPVALVFGRSSDAAGVAKVLIEYAKQEPALVLKAGFLEGRWFGPEEVSRLSKLGSRQELLAELAGSLYSCVSQIAGVLQAPIRDLASVLTAVKTNKK